MPLKISILIIGTPPLLGQQGVQNLPGLVDEEEEPLEVANCGVAEI